MQKQFKPRYGTFLNQAGDHFGTGTYIPVYTIGSCVIEETKFK